ncbi:MAG TPA: NAD(P)-dependent oxidoreductase [Vicinamibacterales bacterium]|jgi:dTDP-glucose 4,6-dehydratase
MTNPLAGDLERVLSQVGPLWEDLRGARLFITGGTGFFGCWLLESLLWANDRLGLGASVVVLTRDPARFRREVPHLATDRAVALHAGDVRTFAYPDGSFTHVVHAAADTIMPNGGQRQVFDTIVDGTRRTLDLARRSSARRFLLASSGAVYGSQPSHVTHLTEEHDGAPRTDDPRSAYGEAKRAAEMACTLSADASFEPVIARGFAFVGPYLRLDGHFAICNFVRDALHGGPVRVIGDGTPYRSYLYASDLATWLLTILLKGTSARSYNVGSGDALTIADLAERVVRAIHPGAAVEIARPPVPGAVAQRYVPSVKRAEEELGLRVSVSLDDAIARTAGWHRKRLVSA